MKFVWDNINEEPAPPAGCVECGNTVDYHKDTCSRGDTMLLKFIELLKEDFLARLSKKTGLGKNELRLEFEQSISVALAKLLDE